jgi:hypothetical protein
MAFINEQTSDGTWQTIDYERYITLIYKGGVGSGRAYLFSFIYRDTEIELEAQRRIEKLENGLDNVTWDITKIDIPTEDLKKYSETISALKEALDACGFLFSRENINTVYVNFLLG